MRSNPEEKGTYRNYFFPEISDIQSSRPKKIPIFLRVGQNISLRGWNFRTLRLTKKLKINFFCFKKFNINQPGFFCILKAK